MPAEFRLPVVDRGSARRLEDVGVETVMEAMRSLSSDASRAHDRRKPELEMQDVELEEVPRAQRIAAGSHSFVKVR